MRNQYIRMSTSTVTFQGTVVPGITVPTPKRPHQNNPPYFYKWDGETSFPRDFYRGARNKEIYGTHTTGKYRDGNAVTYTVMKKPSFHRGDAQDEALVRIIRKG